jgi:hypothetical protein
MKYYKIGRYDYSSSKYLNLWTSVWDFHEDKSDTFDLSEEYFDVEKNYIDFASKFLDSFDLDSFSCTELERNLLYLTKPQADSLLRDCQSKFDVNDYVNGREESLTLHTERFFKLCLRGVIWGKLKNSNGCIIAPGHDYYWIVCVPEKFNVEVSCHQENLYCYPINDPWAI